MGCNLNLQIVQRIYMKSNSLVIYHQNISNKKKALATSQRNTKELRVQKHLFND